MKYTYITAAVALGIAALIYASQSPAEPQKTITIGAAISKTGFAADYGDMAEKAMALAVEEINANGGSVRLVVEDDETNPTKAVSAYRKLVDVNRADAVIGSIFDFTTQPLLPLALKDKKILIVPAQPTIKGSFEMNAQTFSMMPPFEKIISTLEPVITGDARATKLGILRYQSDFGKEIERVLGGIAATHNIPFTVQSYEKIGAGDFRTQILKLKQDGVNVLFLDMLTPDVITFKKQASELGYSPRVITYSLFDAVAADAGNESRYEGDYWLDWQDTNSPEFAKKFTDRYGIQPRRGAEASYKAVYVLVGALTQTDPRTSLETKFTSDHTAENALITVHKYTNRAFAPLAQVGQ
jgi:ABC-type branched-subunit amino acid transport system substrate-binding protein